MKRFVRCALSLFLCFAAAVMTVSCSYGSGARTVMSIGGFDVTSDIYRYVVINSRSDTEYGYGGENVWQSSDAEKAEEELRYNIRVYLSKLYTVCSLGREYGVEWDSDEIKAAAVLERDAAVENAGGEDQFSEQLRDAYMTDEVYSFIVSNDILNGELPELISKDDEIASDLDLLREEFLSESFVRVKQILIGGENSGTDEENLARAEQILTRLREGADFDTLSREYNNDLYMFQNEDGYYIMRGTRSEEFEEAAFSLQIGEISDIVKTDAGYSIILRCEKDPDYFDRHSDLVLNEYTETRYTEKFEERCAEIFASFTELPDDVDILTLS